MSYQQLTESQRYQISLLYEQKSSQRAIARKVGVAPSAICLELRRNSCLKNGYAPDKAHQKAMAKRHASKGLRQPLMTQHLVSQLLSETGVQNKFRRC